MAGVPQLIRDWRTAKAGIPYARAVIEAAIDATRLGARSPLPEDFLRDAARGYCNRDERAAAPPTKWFKTGKDLGVALLRGVAELGSCRVDRPVYFKRFFSWPTRGRRGGAVIMGSAFRRGESGGGGPCAG
jgi:hypothetical protein